MWGQNKITIFAPTKSHAFFWDWRKDLVLQKMMKKYLIGIDDTDTAESRGTGYHARQMALQLEAAGLASVHGITRHQNYVHPGIRYTSQNSSACLLVETDQYEETKAFCRRFLLDIAPEGSDVGICIIETSFIPRLVLRWGSRAKYELLTKTEALEIVSKFDIYLEGLTGRHDGIIGALAAVGLRSNGNDGRFIWLRKQKELRDLKPGFYTPAELKADFGIEQIFIRMDRLYHGDNKIWVHDWFRPVLKNNRIALIIEKYTKDGQTNWKVSSKDYIRSHS
jgi:hypothetical protein